MRIFRFSILLNTVFLLQSLSSFTQSITQPSELVDIGNRRELFVDQYIIQQLKGVQIVMHEPIDEGPVLYFDNCWEGPFSGYATIIHHSDKYQLYYRGLPSAGKDGTNNESTCYAESKDGIEWTKPNLNLFKVGKSTKNNVILANDAPFSHNFSPFYDSNPEAIATEKYKAVAGTRETGLFAFISADGIHWKKKGQEPIFNDGIFDSQNVAFWSESESLYVCYFRTWSKEGYSGVRTISRTTSSDFLKWSEPNQMSFGDTPTQHLYTNQTHPYFRAPHIYVSIAARFMPGRQVISETLAAQLNVNPKYYKDCSDAIFMTSRGGYSYDRSFMQCFICPGIGIENWVSRTNYPALNVVQTGETEMSVYVNQDYAQPTSHLRRYSLRLDGFVSAYAPYEGGELITKPVKFNGNKLTLNVATSAAGGIKVEIQDEHGAPLPGYSEDEAKEIIGNDLALNARWENGPGVEGLIGKTVRLRFIMHDAHLYAFQFVED